MLGFPQTRWLHWLRGRHREFSLANLLLLALGFVLAPLSWLADAGVCMEVRAGRTKKTLEMPPFFGNGCFAVAGCAGGRERWGRGPPHKDQRRLMRCVNQSILAGDIIYRDRRARLTPVGCD